MLFQEAKLGQVDLETGEMTETVEAPPPPPSPPPETKKAESKIIEKPKGKKGKGKKTVSATDAGAEADPAAPPPPPEPTPEEIEQAQNQAAKWKAYEDYLDKLISTKLIESVTTTFQYFVDEMQDDGKLYPLFEILAELHEPLVVYVPSIELDDPTNLLTFIQALLEDAHTMGKKMPRIGEDKNDPDYYNDILNDFNIDSMFNVILNSVSLAIDCIIAYEKEFNKYAYLWMDNRADCLQQFLLYGRMLNPEEIEMLKDDKGPGIKETPPTTEQFKVQIDLYEDLYKVVEKIETERIINTWLRIDLRPLRQAILNTVCKWGNMYKQHLVDHVVSSLEELENFIQESIKVMQEPLAEDDYDGLLKVMGYLYKVKERMFATDNMFEPLKQIIDLLKNYGVEFSEEIHVQLQELPDKWTNCKKVLYMNLLLLFMNLT